MKEIVQNRSASEQNTRVADIFRKYQAQLKGFISRRVSSKEDSEDILQNVFYQFMKYDQEDSPIEQIAAWLYSVAPQPGSSTAAANTGKKKCPISPPTKKTALS